MVPILQKDAPVLREIAKPVTKDMFGTPELTKILRDMSEALASQDDGVAIAAPQIGVSLRIFAVAGDVFELMREASGDADDAGDDSRGGDADGTSDKKAGSKRSKKRPADIVFINPKIVKLSRDKEVMEEGCLSVRPLYGNTVRSKKARIRAQDANGKEFELGGTGLLAQIFQHETDHLEGVLFIDHATDLRDMNEEKK
ncbi:MAG: peptide deformylase [bacterium]|nr:peptide deformylase [bacterium]